MHVYQTMGELGQGGECDCNYCDELRALREKSNYNALNPPHGPPFTDIYEDTDMELLDDGRNDIAGHSHGRARRVIRGMSGVFSLGKDIF